MSGLLYHTDQRHVVPQLERFGSYQRPTSPSGELQSKKTKREPISKLKIDDVDEKYFTWRKSRDILLAGDLLSQAIVVGNTELFERLKKEIAAEKGSQQFLHMLDPELSGDLILSERIRYNHEKLEIEPKDALTWTDQAINHLSLNSREESLKCIEEALLINPNLGFVVRNASRIFNLTGDNDRAIKVLKKSENYKYDPQIVSAEISFSQMENRRTKGLDIGIQLIKESKFVYREKSELASTLATIEHFKKSHVKAERLFELSLQDPTVNSFAQSIWYKKDLSKMKKFVAFSQQSEVQTHLTSNSSNFIASYHHARKWMSEEPYSLRPFKVAAHLGGVLLRKYDEAFDLKNRALMMQRAIKGDAFTTKDEREYFNDLAYYLLKSDKVEQAETYLESMLHLQGQQQNFQDIDAVIVATLGLLAYKRGNRDSARDLYKRSIKHFVSTKNYYLAGSAFLNFFEEELKYESNKEEIEKLWKQLNDIIDPKYNDLVYRKFDVEKLYHDHIKTLI